MSMLTTRLVSASHVNPPLHDTLCHLRNGMAGFRFALPRWIGSDLLTHPSVFASRGTHAHFHQSPVGSECRPLHTICICRARERPDAYSAKASRLCHVSADCCMDDESPVSGCFRRRHWSECQHVIARSDANRPRVPCAYMTLDAMVTHCRT